MHPPPPPRSLQREHPPQTAPPSMQRGHGAFQQAGLWGPTIWALYSGPAATEYRDATSMYRVHVCSISSPRLAQNIGTKYLMCRLHIRNISDYFEKAFFRINFIAILTSNVIIVIIALLDTQKKDIRQLKKINLTCWTVYFNNQYLWITQEQKSTECSHKANQTAGWPQFVKLCKQCKGNK